MTLWDRWGRYAEVGEVIDCPEMELMAGDHEPPIVVGSGRLVVASAGTYTYELTGVPADHGHAMRSLNRLKADPYDGTLRSRLRVVDTAGIDINAGWTMPSVVPGDAGKPWRFTGECDSLWIIDDAPAAAGSEDVFLLPRHHRSRLVFRRFFDEAPGGSARERRVPVGVDEVVFTLEDDADRLTILAPASERLPLTYTENWLAEPLRIMFGQLCYPRMVGRRQGGRTMVSIRPSNRWDWTSDVCALWRGPRELIDRDRFWTTYAALLSFIADARGRTGDANFEPNKLTRLYEEVIQATHSSRWIWALAHASAIEGIVQMIVPRGTPKVGANAAEVADFCKFIDKWPGASKQLGQVAKNAASRTLYSSPVQFLREMRDAGEITSDEFVAWDTLRNQVAHGSLVSSYSSAEEDALLLGLSSLMHSVTRKLTSAP